MLRRLAVLMLVAAAPAVAQNPAPAHAQVHAALMSGAPMDSAQCATIHAALHQHFAGLGLDSTQMIALHTLLLSQAGVVQLDSIQLVAVHTTLHAALANGSLDADHIAMLHTLLSDSTHLAAIRSCFAASAGSKAPQRH